MNALRLALLAALLAAPPALRLEVSPHLATAPQDLHVRVFVPREVDNRWLEVWTVSPDFGRSTGVELHGIETAGVFDWWWLALPCGVYIVRARVTRADGSTRDARDSARYVGALCEVTSDR